MSAPNPEEAWRLQREWLRIARDERLSRASSLALIEDARRWQTVYERVCDEKAAAEARVAQLERSIQQMLNELGVPVEGYPMPVSNAVHIGQEAIRGS
jgi:hypothetical protein